MVVLIEAASAALDSCARAHSSASVQQRFARARSRARKHLDELGAELRGRVFVYRGLPFDWTRLLAGCFDPHAYAHTFDYASDYHFAQVMLGSDAPWLTANASEARLFVVPTLLGLGPEGDHGPALHSHFVRSNATVSPGQGGRREAVAGRVRIQEG